MPKLNEYLGGIVSELASARKMADLQTLEIAKEYASDEMLKNFSIPRMKIGTVDLTIPFAKAGSQTILKLRDFAYDEITKVMKTNYNASDISSDKDLKTFLFDMEIYYDDVIDKIKKENTSIITAAQEKYFDTIPEYITDFCVSLPNFKWGEVKSETLHKSLKERTLFEARKVIEKAGENEIIVEASKLMSLDPKCLIYAKMSVSESGMEWSRYEDINGNIIETLIPE
ncbi:hypothetical protein MKJ01_02465 [Chryseobacterium sp. SSA4.19]|uniref:hypothetical protein n=1 Tax=Chryseobacterium sp. SSA4.19 TaxID=2919915 RepID=UPI001F4E5FC9|nr:hypothetical protein [Chryseobacterium sp. SSA4.19]MCJ8152624.1 hypothetical protein [Chryseobacterium sp. SSA4.19]